MLAHLRQNIAFTNRGEGFGRLLKESINYTDLHWISAGAIFRRVFVKAYLLDKHSERSCRTQQCTFVLKPYISKTTIQSRKRSLDYSVLAPQ